MGLLDRVLKWFQKKGAVGGIARWVHKMHRAARKEMPDDTEGKILDTLLHLRFKKVPPQNPEEQMRLNLYLEKQEPRETNGSIFGIRDREDLCLKIVHIEMDVTPMDGKPFYLAQEVVREELKRLDREHNLTLKE